MTSRWKLLWSLVGIYVLGVLTGGSLMLRFGPASAPKPPVPAPQVAPAPEQWGPAQLRNFINKLDLTPDQGEDIKIIIDQAILDLNRARRASQIETARLIDKMEADIEPLLTTDQLAKLKEIQLQRRERFRLWLEERNKRLRGQK